MKFKRKQSISESLAPNRALIVYGPRRVGKTTLLQEYLGQQSCLEVLSRTGDDIRIQEVFASQSLDTLKNLVAPYDIVALDEAQQIPNVGLGVKMLIDALPEKQYLLTGSSSFDLSHQVGEPLTGRHFTLTLLPLAQMEIQLSTIELQDKLEEFLRYGAYPEVLLAHDSASKERILRELVSSYLYKDVLALDKIKSPDLLKDITRMLAFQIGGEVSLNEIAVALKTDVKTVQRYIDLLEKMFIIKRVRGFSRNLRNEITKKARYYFLDLGIRNAIIERFQPLETRDDAGMLFENFVFMELQKQDALNNRPANYYFWRTHTGAEVDIIREQNGQLEAIECKWSKIAKVPALWRKTYPDSIFSTINRNNYLERLLVQL
jgi:uncharacterized protein